MEFLEKMTFLFWTSLIFLLFYASTIYFDFFGINKKIKYGYYFVFNNIIPVSEKNSNKKLKLKLSKAAAFISHIVFLVFLIAVFFSVAYPYGGGSEENKLTGPLGDLFNGLITPILSFLTFCGLLITIMIQNLQMKATLQELALTRKEMEDSTTALEAQVKTSTAQKFDSNFYSLLELHTSVASALERKTTLIDEEFSEFNKMSSNWCKFLNENELRRFFLINYQILKLIKKNEDQGSFEFEEAKQYSNIVRATLSDPIYGLIFLNCSLPEFKKYKELVEYYSFFEHYVFAHVYDPFYLKIIKEYSSKAFGDGVNVIKALDDNRSYICSFIGKDFMIIYGLLKDVIDDEYSENHRKFHINDMRYNREDFYNKVVTQLSELSKYISNIDNIINNLNSSDFLLNPSLYDQMIAKKSSQILINNNFNYEGCCSIISELNGNLKKWKYSFDLIDQYIVKIKS